jgi:N-acetylglucosamine-6-phosphate deacetylase
MGKLTALRASRLLTPDHEIESGVVLIENGRIVGLGSSAEIQIPAEAELIDAGDKMVAPGFIDTHVHGRDGHLFGEDPESTADLCRTIASTGTTSLLPTLGSWSGIEKCVDEIRMVRQVMRQGTGGAEILGIHMEGPYLSAAEIARGSQPVRELRKPSTRELADMMDASEGTIRKMTIAPELEGALDVIREMVRMDILPSAGHTAATYEQMQEGIAAGIRSCCHTFNGMIPFHHRSPGVLGAVLTCDEVNAELIADCQHVSAVAMQILCRCKGADRIHLVTDNTYWAGLPNGPYEWSEGRVVIKDDQRVYVKGGTLAGSVASMNFDLANMVRHVGCSLAEAVKMATLNPARVIGVADHKGSLEAGKDADLIIIDADVNVYLTMVKGKVVYRLKEI